MPKPVTISLAIPSVLGLLLFASFSIVFGLNGRASGAAQAIEIQRQAEELFQEALKLSATKELELTRTRLSEAVRLWVQAREEEKAALACIRIGDSYRLGKNYQEALYHFKQALDIKPLSGHAKAIALNSIALVYAELFQSELAVRYYESARNQAHAVNDFSAEAQALSGLADVYYQQKETKKAIACIEQARQLLRNHSDQQVAADLAYLNGRIAQEKEQAKQAREAFEEALAIYQKIGNEVGHVKALCAISNLCLVTDQKQAALEQAQRAVDLVEIQRKQAIAYADIIKARDLRWRALLSRARAERALGQKEIAVKSFGQAIFDLEGVFLSVHYTSEASAVAFREECQSPYREQADLFIELGQIELGQLDEAYRCAQSAKARALFGLMEARRMTQQLKKDEKDDALRELSRSIVRIRSRILSSKNSLEQARLQKELSDAEYAMREAKLKAEMDRPGMHIAWSPTATATQLQKMFSKDEHILLEYFLGENRSFAWLISSKDVSYEILPGRKEIEKKVREVLDLVSVAPTNLRIERDMSKFKERAGKLFSTLFGRLSKKIVAGQKLIIAPDGLLYCLPFEMLVNNGHFLVEDHEISYALSASMLISEQKSGSSPATEYKKELLAFGDPIFSRELKAPGRKAGKSRPKYPAHQMRSFHGFDLAQLPRTRDEVRSIAGLFPGRQQQYLGKDSTEKALKQESLRQYRRLHFATHSLIDEKSPSRSAVVLTLNNDPEEDGFLEVSEISELDLDCDLVVLSACQTGRGQMLTGEGIVGLSRAFLYAGARSVVVSLWDVSDISTGQLMKSFYQHLTSSNSSNAAALREAKLKMLQSRAETRHPFFWAPFIIIGKP